MSRIPSETEGTTPENGTIRVLIVDDHAVVRDGIATIIGMQGGLEVIGQAGSGEEACELYFSLQPDVLVLDLRLPDLDGTEVIRRIRARNPEAHILILTTFGGDEDIYRALLAGAQGYLLKDSPRAQLLEAIRTVHSGERAVPAELARRVADHLGDSRLTPREQEVLEGIAQGNSNRGIAVDLGVSEGTVKSHINNLLAKLGATSRTDAVVKSLRRGLLRI